MRPRVSINGGQQNVNAAHGVNSTAPARLSQMVSEADILRFHAFIPQMVSEAELLRFHAFMSFSESMLDEVTTEERERDHTAPYTAPRLGSETLPRSIETRSALADNTASAVDERQIRTALPLRPDDDLSPWVTERPATLNLLSPTQNAAAHLPPAPSRAPHYPLCQPKPPRALGSVVTTAPQGQQGQRYQSYASSAEVVPGPAPLSRTLADDEHPDLHELREPRKFRSYHPLTLLPTLSGPPLTSPSTSAEGANSHAFGTRPSGGQAYDADDSGQLSGPMLMPMLEHHAEHSAPTTPHSAKAKTLVPLGGHFSQLSSAGSDRSIDLSGSSSLPPSPPIVGHNAGASTILLSGSACAPLATMPGARSGPRRRDASVGPGQANPSRASLTSTTISHAMSHKAVTETETRMPSISLSRPSRRPRVVVSPSPSDASVGSVGSSVAASFAIPSSPTSDFSFIVPSTPPSANPWGPSCAGSNGVHGLGGDPDERQDPITPRNGHGGGGGRSRVPGPAPRWVVRSSPPR